MDLQKNVSGVLIVAVIVVTAPRDAEVAARDLAGDVGERAPSRDDEKNDKEWKSPRPAAAEERFSERTRMVERQIASSRDLRKRVESKTVLDAMRSAPRHVFVPDSLRDGAYADTPLPIGRGQTISQPYIVAFMTELLELTPDSKVLEIGTGSGYQAAVLAHLTKYVYTVEIIEPLARQAKKTLRGQGYKDIHFLHADGYYGWKEKGPFDAIIVTCAAGHLPPPLWQQLKPGGRIVIPIGGPLDVQRLVVATKTKDGKRRTRAVMSVRFVPLTRDKSKRPKDGEKAKKDDEKS